MADRLSGGNVAVALLANSLATGAALVALILTFGAISGAHFNPIVSALAVRSGWMESRDFYPYVAAQFVGGLFGTITANLMFRLPLIKISIHERSGPSQFLGEFVATFGLLAVIMACAQLRPTAVPYAVGGYITGAYWFTSSTSFANPAVTVARCFSDTFAGIRPRDTSSFIVAQVAGAASAYFLFRWMLNERSSVQEVAHPGEDHAHSEVVSSGDHVIVAD